MARVTRNGYAQAAHTLAHDDLMAQLQRVRAPLSVLCGELDRVTPPAACEAIAREVRAPFHLLRGVAHACYVEDANGFNAALRSALAATPEGRHD
jgi:pimeloyl-ACP methyl ester carboxylesterase